MYLLVKGYSMQTFSIVNIMWLFVSNNITCLWILISFSLWPSFCVYSSSNQLNDFSFLILWSKSWIKQTCFSSFFKVQWKLLNVITDYVTIRLMWSNWPRFSKSQITLSKLFYARRRFVYCYHSDIVITLWPKVITLSSFHCN